MGNRSLYPPSVEVHARHLQNTETQRIESDKRIIVDTTTRGVTSGLVVSVGSPATTINVAIGSAYAPNGEYMQLTTAQSNVVLADYVAGNKNYVVLVYDELPSSPEARETDGTTANTRATVTPRLVVLTELAYSNLPPSDSVLTNNAQDRACVIAIVTANGAGIALTSGSIQSPTSYGVALSTTQPVNITGVSITAIDSETSVGVGSLNYVAGSGIQWMSPADSYGALLDITAIGSYVLTSSSGYTLTISHYAALPLTSKTDSITVTSLYSQTVPRHSATDIQHRSMLGTGVASLHNPHGLTILDLGGEDGGSVVDHQDIMHVNGISRDSDPDTLKVTVVSGGAVDSVTIQGFGGSDRAYIKGKLVNTVTPTAISWSEVATATQSLWGIYLSYEGVASKHLRAQFPPSSVLSASAQIVDIVGISSSFMLNQDNGGGGDGFYITVGSINGPKVFLPTYDTTIRLYDFNNTNYVDVFVKGGMSVSEAATITVSPEPDLEEYIPLGNVTCTGVDLGVLSLGYGFGSQSAPNRVHDRRPFGNLDESNTLVSAGITNSAEMVSDLLGDGICLTTHITPGSTDGEFSVESAYYCQFTFDGASTVSGGAVYLGGHKLFVPAATLALVSGVNKIYVDTTGTIHSSIVSWPEIISLQYGKPIVRLYELTFYWPSVTDINDIREFVGQKRDVPMGVVGLDINGGAEIESNVTVPIIARSNSNNAIEGHASGSGDHGVYGASVYATGAGVGVYGTGGPTGVYGVGMSTGVFGLVGVETGKPTETAGVMGYSTSSYGIWGASNTAVAIVGRSGANDTPSIEGWANAPSGIGIKGSSTNNTGVWGNTTGTGNAVVGDANSGYGVKGSSDTSYGGYFTGATGAYGEGDNGYGIHGKSTGGAGFGVYGEGTVIGVRGSATADGVHGVYGSSTYATGTGVGVYGAGGPTGVYGNGITTGVKGVVGTEVAPSANAGVYGSSNSTNTIGVYGKTSGTGFSYGVLGESTTSYGGYFTGPSAVYGEGSYGYGVYGKSTGGASVGVLGEGTVAGIKGLVGSDPGGLAVAAVVGATSSDSTHAIYGKATGATSTGVYGHGTSYGVQGFSTSTAVVGSGGTIGVNGIGSIFGVIGSSPTGTGVHGSSTSGVGGMFEGNTTRAPLNIGVRTVAPSQGVVGDIYIWWNGASFYSIRVCYTTGTPGGWLEMPFP
jgi:hypothetical protein